MPPAPFCFDATAAPLFPRISFHFKENRIEPRARRLSLSLLLSFSFPLFLPPSPLPCRRRHLLTPNAPPFPSRLQCAYCKVSVNGTDAGFCTSWSGKCDGCDDKDCYIWQCNLNNFMLLYVVFPCTGVGLLLLIALWIYCCCCRKGKRGIKCVCLR